MKIIRPDDFNWEDKSGYSKKILFDLIQKDGIVVQEVKIKAGEKAKSHYHKIQTEIFYFINNNGKWIVNKKNLKPKAGEILVVGPFDKHEVINETTEDYLYLAFKYNYQEDDIFWD